MPLTVALKPLENLLTIVTLKTEALSKTLLFLFKLPHNIN